MKKTLLIFTFILALSTKAVLSFADTNIVIAGGDFDVPDIWSLEFYTDENVLYTTSVPFTRVDPRDSWVESDGREANPGKSDIGLLCRTNLDTTWYMKMQGSEGELITLGKLKYGLWQPYYSISSSCFWRSSFFSFFLYRALFRGLRRSINRMPSR